jgi:hypothetical protein
MPCGSKASGILPEALLHPSITLKYYDSVVILGRRKISGFHPEIWLYSGILVILNNYKNATASQIFR